MSTELLQKILNQIADLTAKVERLIAGPAGQDVITPEGGWIDGLFSAPDADGLVLLRPVEVLRAKYNAAGGLSAKFSDELATKWGFIGVFDARRELGLSGKASMEVGVNIHKTTRDMRIRVGNRTAAISMLYSRYEDGEAVERVDGAGCLGRTVDTADEITAVIEAEHFLYVNAGKRYLHSPERNREAAYGD